MALTIVFQLFLIVSLIVYSSCMAGSNELEGLKQSGDGYLTYMMLKIISNLETDIQELKAQVDLKARTEDMQELKAQVAGDSRYIQELKAEAEDMQELKAQVADDSRYIQELKSEIAELKAINRDQPKAVVAQMQLLGTKVYNPRDRVYFTKTVANVGNAYDTQHGFFEAPYDGTYLISVTLCTSTNNYVQFQIVKEGTSISEVISGDLNWTTCGSTTAVTQMNSGSRAWVEMDQIYGGTVNSGHGIPSFTAVLLNNNS